MIHSPASKLFRLAAYSVAGASAIYEWSYGAPTNSVLRGVQYFALTSVFDQAARYLLARNAKPQSNHICTVVFAPLIEECMYSGVLLTESASWLIPRWAAAFFTGVTAARALTGRVTPEQNKQGFTPDTKIGFLWSISREVLLQTLPAGWSFGTLLLADSCVFALAEVCPSAKTAELPKFQKEWTYKVLSAAFFRLAANTVAKTHGIAASITQHWLFNIHDSIAIESPLKVNPT